LSSTELDFRKWPIVQFCQGKYPTKTKLLAIIETQDKLRQLAVQAACNAGGLQCRWLAVQVACSAGGLQCRLLAMQVACSAGGLQCRWLAVQGTCIAGCLQCRILAVQVACSADGLQQSSITLFNLKILSISYYKTIGNCETLCFC
jgi:hypothetical protein